MKKSIQTLLLLAWVGSMSFISSCSKDDLFTSLSNEASPERATTPHPADMSGAWAVKNKITLPPNPGD